MPATNEPARRRRHLARLALLACCALVGGCNLLGVAAYKFSGPPKVPAKYKPPPTEPMLVLVENSRNPSSLRIDADRLTRAIAEGLEQHKVAPLVEPGKLTDFRRERGAGYAGLAITTVGRSLGADQVLYVDLIDVSVEPAMASEMLQGKAEARVRVVDVQSGQTRWPTDASLGQPVTASTSYTRATAGAGEPAVRDALLQALSDQITRLFYDWKSDTTDGAGERPLER